MTGMDVLRRCRAYEKDMERLRLRLDCARDAAMRVTRSAEVFGHGGQSDKMGEYAARVDAIEREMQDRMTMQMHDVEAAARLVSLIEPMQGTVLHMRLVRGMTVRETAASLHVSCDSVRGLYRRGREAMDSMIINAK